MGWGGAERREIGIGSAGAGAGGGGGRTDLVHDSSLLLQRHGDGILVAVPMQSNLMSSIGNHATFFGEGLERVAGDEPGGLDVVLVEHLQQTAYPDCTREQT